MPVIAVSPVLFVVHLPSALSSKSIILNLRMLFVVGFWEVRGSKPLPGILPRLNFMVRVLSSFVHKARIGAERNPYRLFEAADKTGSIVLENEILPNRPYRRPPGFAPLKSKGGAAAVRGSFRRRPVHTPVQPAIALAIHNPLWVSPC